LLKSPNKFPLSTAAAPPGGGCELRPRLADCGEEPSRRGNLWVGGKEEAAAGAEYRGSDGEDVGRRDLVESCL
jgi:hypothetical protein